MKKYYFEINPRKNIILDSPKELDSTWKNISGIDKLEDNYLQDLSWGGYPEGGFLRFCQENYENSKSFSYEKDVFVRSMFFVKDLVTRNRKSFLSEKIIINENYSINLTNNFKISLLMKYNECLFDKNLKFKWKFNEGFLEYDSEKFISLYKKIQNHIGSAFEEEQKINSIIENCSDLYSLLRINTEIKLDLNFTI